jgi:hypothetical protein
MSIRRPAGHWALVAVALAPRPWPAPPLPQLQPTLAPGAADTALAGTLAAAFTQTALARADRLVDDHADARAERLSDRHPDADARRRARLALREH